MRRDGKPLHAIEDLVGCWGLHWWKGNAFGGRAAVGTWVSRGVAMVGNSGTGGTGSRKQERGKHFE